MGVSSLTLTLTLGPVYSMPFSDGNSEKSSGFGLPFTIYIFVTGIKRLKTARCSYGFKGRQIIPLSLFESVTTLFRFQAFSLERFIAFSNRSVFKIAFILHLLQKVLCKWKIKTA